VLLTGCASEWRADRPAKPITYEVPAYRAERSVGNLRRLAILPARMKPVGYFAIPTAEPERESRPSGMWLSRGAATYLASAKGYETVLVADDQGVWRPEALVRAEFGSVRELAAAWDAARTEQEVEAVVQRIGRALGVDGVVVLWSVYSAVDKNDAQGVGWGLLNILLLNIPLFYAIGHPYAGATIYEAASGKPAWKIELSGMQSPASGSGTEVSASQLFENLENAIPRQLVK
jgi:hypothetical protein